MNNSICFGNSKWRYAYIISISKQVPFIHLLRIDTEEALQMKRDLKRE